MIPILYFHLLNWYLSSEGKHLLLYRIMFVMKNLRGSLA
jgi:hypothetical protein